MSTSKADNAVDELDLSDIFSLFKRWFYSVLALFFKGIDFVFKFWWAILLLIVIGGTIGKFNTPLTKYKATVIVKTNFDTQSYVYNALEQMTAKIIDEDTLFIAKNKLGDSNNGILSAGIEPIIDVITLLGEVSETDDRNLSEVLKRLPVEEEETLFASEQFYTNYKYHKLELVLLGKDKAFVKNTLDYINNQPSILEIKKGYIINQNNRIKASDKTITQIDALLDNYATSVNSTLKEAKNLSYFNKENDINLSGIVEVKEEMILDIEELKNDQITSTDALIAVGNIQIAKDLKFKDKKHIFYPVVLVFIFLLIAGIRYSYNTLRRRLVEENFLD